MFMIQVVEVYFYGTKKCTLYASEQLNIKLAIIHRSFQQSFRSTSASRGGRGSSGKMFFVAGAKNTGGSGGGNERR